MFPFLGARIPTSFQLDDHHYYFQQHHDSYSSSPLASTPTTTFSNDTSDATFCRNALALLQQQELLHRRAITSHSTLPSDIPVHSATPTSSPHDPKTTSLGSNQLSVANTATRDWQMYAAPYNSMGGPVTSHGKGVKRTRSHQRTPSASTVASNGPVSPFMHNSLHPQIANIDRDLSTPAHYADQTILAKNLPTPSQTPTDSVFTNYSYATGHPSLPNAHMAMKGFGIDHHLADDIPDFAPSRQSMSSYGNDSPATPQSGAGDVDMRSYGTPAHDVRQSHPNVQFQRTESQAFQDELYNPNAMYGAPTSVAKPNNNYLSPHRQLNDRLQLANAIRSSSPSSAVSRERSPFVAGSVHAPQQDWSSAMNEANAQPRKQHNRPAQSDYAFAAPPLRREPTKTVSPKETFLDYNDPDQPSLLHDSAPSGYKVHSAGTEQWPNNQFLSQPGPAYGHLTGASDQTLGFRNNATSAEYAVSGFDFTNILPPTEIQNNQYQPNYQNAGQPKMNGFHPGSEQTPDFPAHLPSMETSISDVGPTHSSQETDITSSPRRPEDTRANTGTYTCTYHGCTQRFDSHNALQKHKRDFHRSHQRDGTSASAAGSTSPRSTESPAPSSTGMTSAAILARNSQAGPHKCTRINPSTNKPCNTVFSRPYDLTRHEDTIHNNRKQKVRCHLCREEKTFSRNDALTRHMRVVHPDVETMGGRRGRRSD